MYLTGANYLFLNNCLQLVLRHDIDKILLKVLLSLDQPNIAAYKSIFVTSRDFCKCVVQLTAVRLGVLQLGRRLYGGVSLPSIWILNMTFKSVDVGSF